MSNLVEKAYKRMPDGIEELKYIPFHRDNYSFYVRGIDESINPPSKFENPATYKCTGQFTIRNEKNDWEITGRVAQGFGLVPRKYNLTDTKGSARDFADYVCHELKYSKQSWMDSKYLNDFVYESLKPFRERKRNLANLVVGVDFGSLDEIQGEDENDG